MINIEADNFQYYNYKGEFYLEIYSHQRKRIAHMFI